MVGGAGVMLMVEQIRPRLPAAAEVSVVCDGRDRDCDWSRASLAGGDFSDCVSGGFKTLSKLTPPDLS